MIDHLNAFAIATDNVRGLAEFYREKLGLVQAELTDDFAYLKFGHEKGPGLALVGRNGLAQEIPEARARPKNEPNFRSYFAVFVEDADRLYEELRAKGVHFVAPPTTRPHGQRYAFFEDPEGNLWEISHFPKE